MAFLTKQLKLGLGSRDGNISPEYDYTFCCIQETTTVVVRVNLPHVRWSYVLTTLV